MRSPGCVVPLGDVPAISLLSSEPVDMDSNDPSPLLDLDIEHLIFKAAARSNRQDIPQLMLVAQRVRVW